jgi:hypothetical protein
MRVTKWGLLIAALLMGLVVASVSKSLLTGISVACVPLGLLAICYWAKFVTGAALFNRPDQACLVPLLNDRVRHTAVLAWLLTMLPMIVACWLNDETVLALLAASLGVTAFGLYRAGRGLVHLTVALLALALYVWPHGHGTLATPLLAAAGLASLLLVGWALPVAFPRGGELHWAMLDKHAAAQALDTTEGTVALLRSGGTRAPVYAMFLRRDLARASARRDVWLHVLDRNAQRWSFALPLVAATAVLLALEPLLGATGGAPDMMEVMSRIASGVLVFMGYWWSRFWFCMRGSSTEQALVRLSPGAPRASKINRALGQVVLSSSLAEWCALFVLALGIALLWGGSITALRVIAAFMCALLSAVGVSLANYSNSGNDGLASQLMMTALNFFIALVSAFWAKNSLVWTVLMALILVISICTIRSRWRAMMAAPVAFPAGRLA